MRKLGNALLDFFRKGDLLLLFLCVFTAVYGIVIIASATNYMGTHRYVLIQTVALAIGILLYVLISLLDVEILAEHRQILTVFNAVFLGMLLIWGVEGTSGNKSWLHFSFLPFNIQPAELCKISFIIILAKTLSVHRNRVSSLRSVGSITLHLLFITGLIVIISKDAGVALTFVFIFLVMAYVGGVRGWWFLGGAASIAAVLPFAWTHFAREDQKQRIMMFFDPTIDPTGEGVRWQTNKSLSALSGGGVAGQGLFHGTMTQSGSVPAQHTDFIFSTIGEELGLIGCILTLLLLAAIIVRCVYVGMKTPNYMNRLICIGIASMLVFQIMVNVGMCIGVFPVIGLTLPFISYGGSSTITMFLAMGLVSGIHMRPDPDARSPYIQARY
ncbi:MAG: FtsW/RodA/SpoVE family cell cycle protein [Candidatus Faecousia sp.]|nr:FtsW/RodA/SpoVE family cell cycle protein [Candidatus Faecousia sp.]